MQLTHIVDQDEVEFLVIDGRPKCKPFVFVRTPISPYTPIALSDLDGEKFDRLATKVESKII